MKRKLIRTVVIFLLLVPFRLTISILLIKLFTFTATVNGENIPLKIVNASVLTSKICYDLTLGIWLAIILNSIFFILSKTGEFDGHGKPKHKDWYVVAMIFSVLAILIFVWSDIHLTNELFWHFNK